MTEAMITGQKLGKGCWRDSGVASRNTGLRLELTLDAGGLIAIVPDPSPERIRDFMRSAECSRCPKRSQGTPTPKST